MEPMVSPWEYETDDHGAEHAATPAVTRWIPGGCRTPCTLRGDGENIAAMRIRAVHVLVPIMILAVSGCNLLKKKKKPTTFDDSPATSSLSLEPPAFNRADLTRFPDEVLLHGQADLVRQITFARTAPDEGGTTVGVIDPNSAVLKWSLRNGSTLVTFDRQAFPGKKFAGWVPDASFSAAATAKNAPPVVGGVKPAATATVAGTSAPPGGQCQLTLRSTSFSPSTPTCSFNEKVRAGSPATLSFPCSGGTAVARFSSQTFTGTADPNRVQISNSTLFPFSGCTVRSVQTISGSPPNLSYFYSESIVSGTCSGVSTCTARGSVSAL